MTITTRPCSALRAWPGTALLGGVALLALLALPGCGGDNAVPPAGSSPDVDRVTPGTEVPEPRPTAISRDVDPSTDAGMPEDESDSEPR